ncbi:MAG: outer membrane lipoprotein LolB [Methylothermaceae bacterium]|nr:outer membrane lipoprotein LolB [Methylothermaceae bacterium]
MSFRARLGLLLLIGLAGCSAWQQPPLPVADQVELAWLRGLDHWRLHGRIGVRGEEDNWHGGVRWDYRKGHDRLVVSGPFGQGGAVIEVWPNWIRIEGADGRIQVSSRPEQLLEQVLGVAVPLPLLHYWVRGLPASGAAEVEYDAGGRLRRLRQKGWEIEYLEYRAVGDGVLPVKLVLSGPMGVRLKLIVDRWEIEVDSGHA